LEYLLHAIGRDDVVARWLANRSGKSLSAFPRSFGNQGKSIMSLLRENIRPAPDHTLPEPTRDNRPLTFAGPAIRILLVDDDPSIAACLSFVFTRPRYEVTCARHGREALAGLSAAAIPYDVIMTDNEMSPVSGVDLVRELRERNFPGKIVVLSGYLTTESREAYAQMKVDAIIDKPFDNYELRSCLELLVT
jgi:CheY-like chemotaxis protein